MIDRELVAPMTKADTWRSRGSVLMAAVVIAVIAIVAGIASSDGNGSAPVPDEEPTARVNRDGGERGEELATPEGRQPRIPRLIGLSPAEVRETLSPLHVDIKFEKQCESVRPRGHVVVQQPEPGRRMTQPEVRVWLDRFTQCNEREASRRCESEDLRLVVSGTRDPEDGSEVLQGFAVKNRGDGACQLRSRVRLRLVRVDGSDLRIRGNPAQMLTDWRIPNGGSMPGGWIWENLCPSKGRWHVEVTVADMHKTDRTATPPCIEPNAASVLF